MSDSKPAITHRLISLFYLLLHKFQLYLKFCIMVDTRMPYLFIFFYNFGRISVASQILQVCSVHLYFFYNFRYINLNIIKIGSTGSSKWHVTLHMFSVFTQFKRSSRAWQARLPWRRFSSCAIPRRGLDWFYRSIIGLACWVAGVHICNTSNILPRAATATCPVAQDGRGISGNHVGAHDPVCVSPAGPLWKLQREHSQTCVLLR